MSERPAPPRFVTLPEIRRAAGERLPREAWNFGDGGAETETTRRRNRRHLDRLAISQNVLVDVREIDLRTSLLGVPLSWPVSVAPMGGLILFHPEGDVEMARGAAQADTLQWLSGATGWPVEEVAKAGKAPQMFQLYHHGDRGWVSELLARVEASGYHAREQLAHPPAIAVVVELEHLRRLAGLGDLLDWPPGGAAQPLERVGLRRPTRHLHIALGVEEDEAAHGRDGHWPRERHAEEARAEVDLAHIDEDVLGDGQTVEVAAVAAGRRPRLRAARGRGPPPPGQARAGPAPGPRRGCAAPGGAPPA